MKVPAATRAAFARTGFQLHFRDAPVVHACAQQMMPPTEVQPFGLALEQPIENFFSDRRLVKPTVMDQFPLGRIFAPQGALILIAHAFDKLQHQPAEQLAADGIRGGKSAGRHSAGMVLRAGQHDTAAAPRSLHRRRNAAGR